MGIVGWASAVNNLDEDKSASKHVPVRSEEMPSRPEEADSIVDDLARFGITVVDDGQKSTANFGLRGFVDRGYSRPASSVNEKVEIDYREERVESIQEEAELASEAEKQEEACQPAPEPVKNLTPAELFFEQLLDCIRSLKLRDSDGSGRCCDITHLELHEAVFMLRHAERFAEIDYFQVVREVHAVKRRILDLTETPDLVSSDNLDDLMKIVEERYEASFGGEVL